MRHPGGAGFTADVMAGVFFFSFGRLKEKCRGSRQVEAHIEGKHARDSCDIHHRKQKKENYCPARQQTVMKAPSVVLVTGGSGCCVVCLCVWSKIDPRPSHQGHFKVASRLEWVLFSIKISLSM